jgi:anthranilate synthase/aminodeoxychorismate synthase-like glutamine amidotransferase
MILIIDNYDSFVYNLDCYVKRAGFSTEVIRNDAVSVEAIDLKKYSHVILSPGPCTPDESGICLALITACVGKLPLLGVCLGHQAIAQAFGGRIVHAKKPMHGMASSITHDSKGIFQQLPQPLNVARYHSLVVEPESFPHELQVTAYSQEAEIMALKHKQLPIVGLQFHPESILTSCGQQLVENFLQLEVCSQNTNDVNRECML